LRVAQISLIKCLRSSVGLGVFQLIYLFLTGCVTTYSSPTQPILPNGKSLLEVGYIEHKNYSPFVRLYIKSQPTLKQSASSRQTLTIYIEGDGAPWVAKEFAPSNPTPRYALGAQLAHQDPSPLVAYLGRPCQYLDDEQLQYCDPQLWTNGRFSEKALDMGNSAIDLLINEIRSKQKRSATSIHLVGYSGGGAYAALLAGRRSDVSCLVTVAAPLDLDAWVQMHRVAPLSTSFNPAIPMPQLRNIIQTHWYGAKDRVVPPQAIGLYEKHNFSSRTLMTVLSDANHVQPWDTNWENLLGKSCPP
jgi:hypothetical protein